MNYELKNMNTSDPSRVTRLASRVTRHASPVTRHASPVTRHASPVTILILFLFIAAGVIHAQSNNNSKSNSGALYATPASSTSTTSSNQSDNGGALYKANASGPGERPGDGEGIGQQKDDTPIGDGLLILLGACIIYGFVKFNKKNINL
jgi:hypothetical protein